MANNLLLNQERHIIMMLSRTYSIWLSVGGKMAPRLYTFQFGRVLVVGRQFTNKGEFYTTVFSAKKPVSDQFNKFLFLDVQNLSVNQETFFVGKLVKYKAKEEDVVIEDSSVLGTSIVDNAVVAQPEFVLHPFTGIIAFRSMPSLFSPRQLRDKFARLVEASFDNFFISTRVEAVNEEFEIQEQFQRFRAIKCISVDLHPSNPHNGDLWKHIDEEIKAYGAAEYQQQLKAPDDGSLNKEKLQQSDVYAGLIMASDGYGYASVEGVLEDGQRVKVTTADNPTEAKTTLDGDSEHLINQLVRTFQSVWKRTKHESKN